MSEETALFIRQKINFQPPAPITHLVACNNYLVLALQNGKIRLIPLQNPDKQDEIDVIPSGTRDTIAFVHLDPTGQHLIVSTATAAEVFYLPKGQNKLKSLSKLKGNVISAIGWNHEVSKSTSTGFIVLGTSRGLLFEAEILSNGNVSYFRQLFCFSDDPHHPLSVVSVNMNRCSSNKDNKWFIFVTVPGRLYPFTGVINQSSDGPVFHTIFLSYQENLPRFHSLTASGDGENLSELHLFPEFGTEPASKFAWLAGPGLEFGNVDPTAADPFKMIIPEKLYSYPTSNNGRTDLPLNFVMTDYHFIMLYNDRLTAVCALNELVMYEDSLGQKFGKLIGICRDPVSGFIWVYTDRNVLKYTPNNETRNLWSIYLEKGDYNLARKYASDNSKHLDIVLQKQCAKLMKEQKYVAAAEIYAMTKATFEEVALKFIQCEDRMALKTFLQKKLDSLQENERTQKAMIVFWLLEILLTELNEAESGLLPQTKKIVADIGSQTKGMDTQKIKALREYFRMFLNKSDVMECLKNNPQAVVQIMSSHGDIESLLYFSDLMKDYESVVGYFIQQEEYDKALNVLKKQRNPDLFYKFSPSLIVVAAKPLVDSWISMESLLKPKSLLAAMFQCENQPSTAEEIIRYLEHFIAKYVCNDQAVHNYLLTLYSKFYPDKLMMYLEKEGKDPTQINYDLKYALRVCIEKNLHRPCVHLYLMIGLFEEAMQLALKVGLNLAKICAKTPENLEIRRKLWLSVARHVVEKEQDIKQCVDLLQESDGLIKIQDLLPYFPNFVTIDHFKESLCTCLAEHSGKIKSLQDEMKEATEYAQQINKQIQLSKNKYVTLKVQETCSYCGQPLMVRSFYAFPCRHNFHSDCIEKEIEPLFSIEIKTKIKELKRQITNSKHISDDSISIHSISSSSVDKNITKRDQILREIDEILGSECPFCGDFMIKSVDRPFFIPLDYLNELKKWE